MTHNPTPACTSREWTPKATLYPEALGAHFQQLAPVLQQFHSHTGVLWRGEATVIWSPHTLLRGLLWLARLPAAGEAIPVQVRLRAAGKGEIWQRHFAGRGFQSRQDLSQQHLSRQQPFRQHPPHQHPAAADLWESFGLATLRLRNRVEAGALHQHSVGSTWLGLPLPARIGLHARAREWAEGSRLCFDVALHLGPLPLLRYTGWLRADAQP